MVMYASKVMGDFFLSFEFPLPLLTTTELNHPLKLK